MNPQFEAQLAEMRAAYNEIARGRRYPGGAPGELPTHVSVSSEFYRDYEEFLDARPIEERFVMPDFKPRFKCCVLVKFWGHAYNEFHFGHD